MKFNFNVFVVPVICGPVIFTFLKKIFCFLCTVTNLTSGWLKTSVGDYRRKYMVIIIPSNGGAAPGWGSSCRGQNCTSNCTGYIYDPDITTVVYGFNGRPWPTFMPALDDCEPTPSFTATTALLLNQLSRPVKATVCEIDVNKLIPTETLQLLQPRESSGNRDLKLVTKSIMIKEVIRTSPRAGEEWERLQEGQSMAAQRWQIWGCLSPGQRQEEELHDLSPWPAASLLMKRWMRPQRGRLAGQLKPQCLLYAPQPALLYVLAQIPAFAHKHAHLWSTSSPKSKICIFIFFPFLICYKLWWYYIFDCASGFKTLRTAQMAATPLCTAEVSAVCLHRWMEEEGFSRLIALRYESDCAKKQKIANQCLPFFYWIYNQITG